MILQTGRSVLRAASDNEVSFLLMDVRLKGFCYWSAVHTDLQFLTCGSQTSRSGVAWPVMLLKSSVPGQWSMWLCRGAFTTAKVGE